MATKRECFTCAFGADEFGRFNHHCHRHAPSVTLGEFGAQKIWPPVATSDFCGDYEAIPPKEPG